jgi:hypothetical protein
VVALVPCLSFLGIIGALELTSFDTGVAACSARDQVRKGGVASLKQEHAAAGPRRHLSRALHGGTCRRYRAHAPPYPDPSPNTSPAELPTLLPCFHSSTFAMMAAPMGGWRSGWPQARQRRQADDAAAALLRPLPRSLARVWCACGVRVERTGLDERARACACVRERECAPLPFS